MPDVSACRRLLKARWVLPMSGPALENGGVEIDGQQVAAVYDAAQLAQRSLQLGESCTVTDFGKAIILPGLINLHTHVDWTAQELVDTESSLFAWIPNLISSARSWSVEDFLTSASAGVRRIARSGTTFILDSSFSGQAAVALSAIGLRGVVALELFGVAESQADEVWSKWLDKRQQLLDSARISDLVKVSVAPHAPYSVCPGLMRRAFKWAQDNDLPVTVHVCETQEELDWIAKGDPLLDEFIEKTHFIDGNGAASLAFRATGKTPVQYMSSEQLLSNSLIAAHAVRLNDQDIGTLQEKGVKIAHCPRSNARLRCGVAPLRRLLEKGVAVGFGTDSAASSDSLDILSEARFAWNLHRAVDPGFPFDAERALRLLTIEAAAAVGMSEMIGSLAPGMQADIAIFNIVSDGPWAEKRPYDALLYEKAVLTELLVNGRKVCLDALY
jgi:cytosine/adenosine deaminase-related metal-dependent hydrolase